jgi:hypothetical protein
MASTMALSGLPCARKAKGPDKVKLDLFSEVRQLVRVEPSLVRTEIGERSAGIPSSLAALVVGVVLLPAAAALFVARFGLPTDAAFLLSP